MKKKILSILFVIILCLATAIPAYAADWEGFASEHYCVIDDAGLLSDADREALENKIDEIRHKHSLDITILTVDSLEGLSAQDYGDYFYEIAELGYGENWDGVLLLVSIEDSDWHITTCGHGITVFTDAGIDYIGDQIVPYMSDGDFAGAFDTFADLCDEFITQASSGEAYDVSNLPKEPLSVIWIPVSIVIGFVIALIIVGAMKSKLKTVRFQAGANNYMKKDSLKVTESRDLFLYHTLVKTPKAENNSSSGGGSSTHTSSSGRTFGGGGGKF